MKFRFTAEAECRVSWEVEVQREKLIPGLRELSAERIAEGVKASLLDPDGVLAVDLKEKLGLSKEDFFRVRAARAEVLEGG